MSIKGNAESYVELRGSLSLPDAIKGKSAYEIALANGFVGTEQEWLESLRSDFEAERIKAERERVAAENARVEAEEKRQEAFDNAINTFDAEREKAVAEFTEEINTLVNDELLPEATATIAQASKKAMEDSVDSAKDEVTYHTDQEKARATTTIETVTSKAVATIEEAVEALDTTEDELWVNDGTFTSGDVEIDGYADYDTFKILFYERDTGDAILGEHLLLKLGEGGKVTTIQSVSDGSTTYAQAIGRSASVSEDGIVTFGYISSLYNSGYCIPYKIYGVKNEKVVVPMSTPSGAVDENVANALKGNIVGEGGVYIEDISPIEHTIEVKCRSKNILDVASATIWTSASGVNEGFELDSERTETGIKLICNTASSSSWVKGGFTIGLTKDFLGKTLTASVGNVTHSFGENGNQTLPTLTFQLCKHDEYYHGGTSNSIGDAIGYLVNTVTWTVPEDADYETYPYLRIAFNFVNGGAVSAGDYAVYEDIMVEFGDTATDYQPWHNVSLYHVDVFDPDMTVQHSYPINEDGSVDGVTSIYPTMIIEQIVVSGIMVEAKYNRDASKVVTSLEERIAALEAAIVSM